MSASYRFGIEEEFFLADAATRNTPGKTAKAFDDDVHRRLPDAEREVMQSQIEIASKPIKAKKTIAAPPITPPNPLGIKGCQFVGLTIKEPNAITKITTASFMMTIVVLAVALSRMPKIRSAVTAATMMNAGKSKAI